MYEFCGCQAAMHRKHKVCVCVNPVLTIKGVYLLTEEEAVATQRALLWLSNMMSLMGASSTSSSSLVRLASCVLHTHTHTEDLYAV